MTEYPKARRLATILWFVAAALAFVAFGIGYSRSGEMNWSSAAAGLFFLSMGIASVARGRRPSQSPPPNR